MRKQSSGRERPAQHDVTRISSNLIESMQRLQAAYDDARKALESKMKNNDSAGLGDAGSMGDLSYLASVLKMLMRKEGACSIESDTLLGLNKKLASSEIKLSNSAAAGGDLDAVRPMSLESNLAKNKASEGANAPLELPKRDELKAMVAQGRKLHLNYIED